VGVDRFLDEQRYGEERRLRSLTHVVVVMPHLDVYGPYKRGHANTVRTRLMASTPGPRQVKVRKLKKVDE
jgi:hypothetical protein